MGGKSWRSRAAPRKFAGHPIGRVPPSPLRICLSPARPASPFATPGRRAERHAWIVRVAARRRLRRAAVDHEQVGTSCARCDAFTTDVRGSCHPARPKNGRATGRRRRTAQGARHRPPSAVDAPIELYVMRSPPRLLVRHADGRQAPKCPCRRVEVDRVRRTGAESYVPSTARPDCALDASLLESRAPLWPSGGCSTPTARGRIAESNPPPPMTLS